MLIILSYYYKTIFCNILLTNKYLGKFFNILLTPCDI